MTHYHGIRWEQHHIKDGAAWGLTGTIERPRRGNSISRDVARELKNKFGELHKKCLYNAQPRYILLKANPIDKQSDLTKNKNQKVWIAGGDLKDLAQISQREEAGAYAQNMSDAIHMAHALPFPVLMALDGRAIGGGVELLMAADFRLATESSSLEFKQLQMGLPTGYGSLKTLISLVGVPRAQALLYKSQTLLAREAHQMGLVQELATDSADLDQKITQLIEDLIGLEPSAFAAQKAMFLNAQWPHIQDSMSYRQKERALFESIWLNPTHKQRLMEHNGRT